MYNDKYSYYCRVCGLYNEDPPWGIDGSCSTFNICDCCGTEFGYHDFTLEGIRQQRDIWLKNPYQWDTPSAKPDDWSLEEQLKNIQKQFL
jgi:hypothetical protein